MDTKENYLQGPPSTSNGKIKRPRKSSLIPVEYGQRCIASAMSKVINKMVNIELQQRCKELLQVEDINDTEARIFNILQQIDNEREEEQKIKENAKNVKGNKKIKINYEI